MGADIELERTKHYECSRETDGGDEDVKPACPKCGSEQIGLRKTDTPLGYEQFCLICGRNFVV